MTEVNYNDGKWHGWNGGECPVHPMSEVETRWKYTSLDRKEMPAGKLHKNAWMWGDDSVMEIVAFRVVKEYKEPREFWLYHGIAYESLENAKDWKRYHGDSEIIHVIEVIK